MARGQPPRQQRRSGASVGRAGDEQGDLAGLRGVLAAARSGVIARRQASHFARQGTNLYGDNTVTSLRAKRRINGHSI